MFIAVCLSGWLAGWVDGEMGPWNGSMGKWPAGQILRYPEGSRNDRSEERNFTPKIATMIKSHVFSKVAAKLGA